MTVSSALVAHLKAHCIPSQTFSKEDRLGPDRLLPCKFAMFIKVCNVFMFWTKESSQQKKYKHVNKLFVLHMPCGVKNIVNKITDHSKLQPLKHIGYIMIQYSVNESQVQAWPFLQKCDVNGWNRNKELKSNKSNWFISSISCVFPSRADLSFITYFRSSLWINGY